jgi:hypothetical protein
MKICRPPNSQKTLQALQSVLGMALATGPAIECRPDGCTKPNSYEQTTACNAYTAQRLTRNC